MALKSFVKSWGPTLGIWSVSAVVGLLYFGEGIPLVNHDVLSKLPVLGKRYKAAPEE